MSKYKLWQGYHDGPQCMARRCPGAPITIEAGTYGEQNCPEAFLCLEVWCAAGIWSMCCAFDVTRRMVREERGLGKDPTVSCAFPVFFLYLKYLFFYFPFNIVVDDILT